LTLVAIFVVEIDEKLLRLSCFVAVVAWKNVVPAVHCSLLKIFIHHKW